MKKVNYGTWLSMSAPLRLKTTGKQIKVSQEAGRVWSFLATSVVTALPLGVLMLLHVAIKLMTELGKNLQHIALYMRIGWVVGAICLLALWPLINGLVRKFMSHQVLLIDRAARTVQQVSQGGQNFTRAEQIIRDRRILQVASNKGSWEEEIQVLALDGTAVTTNEAELLTTTDTQKLRWLAEQLSRMYDIPLEDRITGLTLQPDQLNLPYWQRFEGPVITGQKPADPIDHPEKIICREEQNQVTFSWGSWWDKRTMHIYLYFVFALFGAVLLLQLEVFTADDEMITFWPMFTAMLVGTALSAAFVAACHRLLTWQLNITRYIVTEELYFLKFPVRKTSRPLSRLEELNVLPIEKKEERGILELVWDDTIIRIRLIQKGSYNDLVWLATEIDRFIRK